MESARPEDLASSERLARARKLLAPKRPGRDPVLPAFAAAALFALSAIGFAYVVVTGPPPGFTTVEANRSLAPRP